jgi:uncharacterized repeat protein (TIGR01451 family)
VAWLVAGIALIPVLSASDAWSADVQEADNPFTGPSAAGQMSLLQESDLVQEPEPPAKSPAVVEFFKSLLLSALGSGQPGVDVLANNPTDDTPENTTQSETTLAVLGNTICAGYNNSGPGGFSGLSRSTNLGATWTDLGGIGQRGDPVLAVHEATGTFYYGEIARIGGNPAIGVAPSTTDCQSFGVAVDASTASSGLAATTLSDKPWIAVDNTGGTRDGDIYVCWTRFIDTDGDGVANTSELRFSRSLDGGATYQNEQVIAPTGTAPFGCSVGVGPNGEVYVAWADRTGATQDDIRFRSSGNGGVNFNPTATIATGNRHPGTDTIVTCDVNRPTLNGNIRMLHQAWLAVDTTPGPFNGNIYVVWASDPAGVPDNSDVFFSRSTNGGAMWSAPVQLGGGGGATDQFEPFVAVAGAGAVSVAWYDRRNDPTNNALIDVYKTFSRDGGATFNPIIRVTDTSFPVPPINPNFDPGVALCYMGEYIAVTGDAHNFYYLWGDNRNTLVTVNFPGGRPDPDVFFDAQVAPVVNDADLSVVKSDFPDPVVAGEQLTYDLSVFNDGPHVALDVVVEDILPPGTTYVSDTDACDISALPTLTCSLGDLAAGDGAAFSIQVSVDPDLVFNAGGPTTITNAASVSGVANDPNPFNNTISENTSVVAEADLEIVSFVAIDPPDELLVGEEADITLRKVITNNGPSTPIDAELTTTATAPGASVSPGVQVLEEPALELDELREVEEVFRVGCLEGSSHTFTFANEIQPLNPEDTDPNPDNNQAEVTVEIECVVPVAINIKPRSNPNSINPGKGTIPIAVLTTQAGEYGTPVDFDATTIDPLSVRFGPRDTVWAETGGAVEWHGRGHVKDSFELDEVTKDGDLDLVLHFRASETGIQKTDTEACAKGEWVDAGGGVHKFFGCDEVRIVPSAN